MGYGDKDQLVYRNFRGVDAKRDGLYPGAFAPQELVERGLLLDGLNLRYSRGRAYWHRNQLRADITCGASTSATIAMVSLAVRSSNVVTCTTVKNHAFHVGENVHIVGATAFGIAAATVFTITGTPTATSFTFAQAGADDSSGALTTAYARPELLTLAIPFVTEDFDQLLLMTDFGHLYYADVDWTETPAQWTYGYSIFDAESWTAANIVHRVYPYGLVLRTATDIMPLNGITGFAMMNEVLFACAGYSATWPYGWPMCFWDGAQMLQVGYETPPATTTGVADATSGVLVAGRYSYKVSVGNAYYESMASDETDVDVAYTAATAYVEPKTAVTPPTHLDTLTVDGITYRFTDLTTVQAGGFSSMPYDVICGWSADAATDAKVTYRVLQATIKDGRTENASGTSIYTPAHATVTAEWAYAGALTRITLTARTTGLGGNSIALAESTADARIHISAALLSGGTGEVHIDLAAIPLGATDVTYRKLYRAYSASLEPGVRGPDFLLLTTLSDNTTVVYADNTPQDELGEAVAFDHAMPPRGGILTHHRDRLWMSAVERLSESYRRYGDIAVNGAVRVSGTVTLTTAAAHGMLAGDYVSVGGMANQTFGGEFLVLTVPSTTSVTYAQAGEADATDGEGLWSSIPTSQQPNAIFYSEIGQPWYWPAENMIEVGSSSPVVALVSWHDQLLILKEDSAFLLTGYGETNWELTEIPGAKGVVGPNVATSPFGVMWAGHGAWELFDGETVRTVLRYTEYAAWTYEAEDVGPVALADGNRHEQPFPSVCWHDGRFYLMTGNRDYCVCWNPEEDAWAVRYFPAALIGVRSWNFGSDHSHILAMMKWAAPAANTVASQYLTIVDSLYFRNNIPSGNYGDSPGTDLTGYYGQVRVELPPLVSEPGDMARPLRVWVDGQWTKPAASADDLHLYISTGANVAWADLGVVTANSCVGIPAGYACPRLRLLLQGNNVSHFVLQGVTVEYQRRTARGA